MTVKSESEHRTRYGEKDYFFCCQGCKHKFDANPELYLGRQLKDPVCGMNVSEDSRHTAVHDGRTYYFCCGGCRDKFVADPGRYLKVSHNEATEPGDKSAIYTCPIKEMHKTQVII